jgi:hemin uptake protein HemP
MNKKNEVEPFERTSKGGPERSDNLTIGAPARILESAELFGVEQEIGIIHHGSMYRLRVTRGGKLILNK